MGKIIWWKRNMLLITSSVAFLLNLAFALSTVDDEELPNAGNFKIKTLLISLTKDNLLKYKPQRLVCLITQLIFVSLLPISLRSVSSYIQGSEIKNYAFGIFLCTLIAVTVNSIHCEQLPFHLTNKLLVITGSLQTTCVLTLPWEDSQSAQESHSLKESTREYLENFCCSWRTVTF